MQEYLQISMVGRSRIFVYLQLSSKHLYALHLKTFKLLDDLSSFGSLVHGNIRTQVQV